MHLHLQKNHQRACQGTQSSSPYLIGSHLKDSNKSTLDPMHVFKNVAQSTWDHIIGKKDTLLARQDMKSINRLPPSTEPRMGKEG